MFRAKALSIYCVTILACLFCGCGEDVAPNPESFSASRDIVAEVSTWPQGKPAALTLAFDDVKPCMFFTVAPALEARGYVATFFVNTAKVGDYWAPWIEMHQYGHELGNHTRHHVPLDSIPLEQARAEIENGRADLLNNIPGLTDVPSFCYPEGASTPDVRAIVLEKHISARGYWGWNDPTPSDYSMICGRNFESLAQCISDIQWAINTRTWLEAYFHEISPDGMLEDDFQRYLDNIGAWRDSLWIATQGTVAKYTIERDRSAVIVSGDNPGRIWLHTDLDARFDVPLSVRLTIGDPDIDALVVDGETKLLDEKRAVWIEVAPGDSVNVVGATVRQES